MFLRDILYDVQSRWVAKIINQKPNFEYRITELVAALATG
jgi:hypothetical protein